MSSNDNELVQLACRVAQRSRDKGNHPFGALLVDRSGTVLLEAENTVVTERDCTGHAETNLVRMASRELPASVIAEATLVTSTEPCAMCAGAIYWSGIPRVVYGLAETELSAMTGSDAENPTMSLSAREVFAHGQREIEVVGPLDVAEARAVHQGFWDKGRETVLDR